MTNTTPNAVTTTFTKNRIAEIRSRYTRTELEALTLFCSKMQRFSEQPPINLDSGEDIEAQRQRSPGVHFDLTDTTLCDALDFRTTDDEMALLFGSLTK